MKKIRLIFCVLLIVTLIMSTLCGCDNSGTVTPVESTTSSDGVNNVSDNLIPSAMNISVNSVSLSNSSLEKSMCAFSGTEKTSVEIFFSEEVTLNTLILKESSEDAVLGFTIEAEQNEEYALIYSQDTVGAYRYCAFDTVTTGALRITVSEIAEEKKFIIDSVEAYLIDAGAANDGFRVVSYLIGANAYNPAHVNPEWFNAVTDVIVFGMTSFDTEGNIIFNDVTSDGNTISGAEALTKVIENIRTFAAYCNRDVRIHCNLLGPDAEGEFKDWDAQMNAKGEAHRLAFEDNRDKLIGGILKLASDYSFDGIYFDYEYPLEKTHYEMYGDFLVALNKALDDAAPVLESTEAKDSEEATTQLRLAKPVELGAALSSWGAGLKSKAINSLDSVMVMAYDMFDSFGNHAPFYSCAVSGIQSFIDAGYKKEQLCLGLPFYARPTDKGGFWYDYSIEAAALGKFGNKMTGKAPADSDTCDTRYYNGRQMVYDKTSYALDNGLAGVMIWHMTCDAPYSDELSLFRAINTAVYSR